MELESLPWNGHELIKLPKRVWGDIILNSERTLKHGSLYLLKPEDPVWILKESPAHGTVGIGKYYDEREWKIEYIKRGTVLENTIDNEKCVIKASFPDEYKFDHSVRVVKTTWGYDTEIHIHYGYSTTRGYDGSWPVYYYIFPSIEMVRRFCNTYLEQGLCKMREGRRKQYIKVLRKLDALEKKR